MLFSVVFHHYVAGFSWAVCFLAGEVHVSSSVISDSTAWGTAFLQLAVAVRLPTVIFKLCWVLVPQRRVHVFGVNG